MLHRSRPAPVDGAARVRRVLARAAPGRDADHPTGPGRRADERPPIDPPESLAAARPLHPRPTAAPDPRAPHPPPGPVPADPVARAAALVADPGRRGVVALGALGLAAALVAASFAWRARPTPVAVPVPEPATTASASAAEVVVDVAGAVRRPGLVRLPPGSRVADAIARAGGLLPGATTVGLNLARRLADGEQVLVLPPGAAPPPGASAGGSPRLLDLNAATQAELEALPGVGPVLAGRIVEWRTKHGRFATVDDLRDVPGIGDRKFEDLRSLVTA